MENGFVMPASLYWLEQSLVAVPLFLLVYAGLGIPAALLLLPRRDWPQRALVLAVACAAGPTLLTTWMFILGTIGGAQQMALLRPVPIILGLGIGGTALLLLAGRKARQTAAVPGTPHAWWWDERLLAGLIVLALALRWMVTAYWPFTTYDALWVYGFQGRLYMLQGFIPTDIGYYPQFLSLQYAFAQIMVGRIDDHAARMALPLLHLGTILAVYALGMRLFRLRRAGMTAAALWTFYPHVSTWAHEGDLEIPLTLAVTLAALFFLLAWRAQPDEPRRRYALLAGLALGVALWIKPTAGGFIWGVMLLVLVAALRSLWRVRAQAAAFRPRWQAAWAHGLPRFQVACWTALACIPVGGMWYARNMLLGHAPVDFPHFSWLDRARRSGDLFGWLLLAGLVLLVWLALHRRQTRQARRWILLMSIGYTCVGVGLLPSMPTINPARFDPPQSYMTLAEALVTLTGISLYGVGAYGVWYAYRPVEQRSAMLSVGWALLLAAPYFLTWFFSYSYHYRLAFAIVPLLLLPTAYLLAIGWRLPRRSAPRLLYGGLLIALCLPGIGASYWNAARDKDWLWTDRYPDDTARYREHHPDMVLVAERLQYFINDYGRDPVVVAPGEQRLPFFFPLMTIISDTVPTRIEELTGATHYIYGSQPAWRYRDEAIDPQDNQVVAALGRRDVFKPILRYPDGIFRYELYELHLANRQRLGVDYLNNVPDDVVFGDFVRFKAFAMSGSQMNGSSIFYDLAFEVLARPQADYRLQLHLVHLGDGKVYHEADTYLAPGEHGYYRAPLWEPGEIIVTSGKVIGEGDASQLVPGDYTLVIGFYVQQPDGTRQFAPTTRNGQPVADYRLLGFRFD